MYYPNILNEKLKYMMWSTYLFFSYIIIYIIIFETNNILEQRRRRRRKKQMSTKSIPPHIARSNPYIKIVFYYYLEIYSPD